MRHPGTFSFVDRITELEPGTRARGSFAVPVQLGALSPCLIAEAVGQLAAWVVMAGHEFRRRPVAALAGAARVMGEAAPGRILDLGVEIESCDADTVVYAGWARMGNAPLIELNRCVGAMLPLEDLDDPEAAREHFEMLRGRGMQRHHPLAATPPQIVGIHREPGRRVRGTLQVPAHAAFFADHFPRKPVLPATLLIDAQMQLALTLAQEVLAPGPAALLRTQRVADLQLRAFILPGQCVDIAAELKSVAADVATFTLTATVERKRVARACIDIVPSGPRAPETTLGALA